MRLAMDLVCYKLVNQQSVPFGCKHINFVTGLEKSPSMRNNCKLLNINFKKYQSSVVSREGKQMLASRVCNSQNPVQDCTMFINLEKIVRL